MDFQISKKNEFDVLEYIQLAWVHRIFVVGVVSVSVVAIFLWSTSLPKVYEARTSFLVRDRSGGKFSNSLSSLGALTGIPLPPSGQNTKEDLIDLLNSDLLAYRVMDKLHLQDVWKNVKTREGIRKRLGAVTKIPVRLKTNLMEIRVQWIDPRLAAEIANGYVTGLGDLDVDLGFTEASLKRKFIEEQLPKVESTLKASEERLKLFTSLLSGQSFTATTATLPSIGGTMAGTGGSVEIARLAREVEIQTSVYITLRKELEATKLEESKEFSPFQVVDSAAVPTRTVAPKIRSNVFLSFFLSLSGSLAWVFGMDWWKKRGFSL